MSGGICLLVAGATAAFLPTAEFTLGWSHSVEKIRWEERYRVDGDRLRLIEASVAGHGAGMEPGPGATLSHGRWTWTPAVALLPELRLAVSGFTPDYDICWKGACTALGTLVGRQDATVVVRACDPPPPAR